MSESKDIDISVAAETRRGGGEYWVGEVVRLARFLRKHFPSEVAENMEQPTEQSGAVTLAIQLLLKYKALKEKQDANS